MAVVELVWVVAPGGYEIVRFAIFWEILLVGSFFTGTICRLSGLEECVQPVLCYGGAQLLERSGF